MRLNWISTRFSLYFSFDFECVTIFSLSRAHVRLFFSFRIIRAITSRNREQRSWILACALRSWWMSVRSAWSLNIDEFMIRFIRKQLCELQSTHTDYIFIQCTQNVCGDFSDCKLLSDGFFSFVLTKRPSILIGMIFFSSLVHDILWSRITIKTQWLINIILLQKDLWMNVGLGRWVNATEIFHLQKVLKESIGTISCNLKIDIYSRFHNGLWYARSHFLRYIYNYCSVVIRSNSWKQKLNHVIYGSSIVFRRRQSRIWWECCAKQVKVPLGVLNSNTDD